MTNTASKTGRQTMTYPDPDTETAAMARITETADGVVADEREATDELRAELHRVIGPARRYTYTLHNTERWDLDEGAAPFEVCENGSDRILGAGATESEALADAIETVRGWGRG